MTDTLERMSLGAGVPAGLRGCHLIRVGGYVVEGHVPAATIRRLLRERPALVAITMPGMPLGTPGMPGPRSCPIRIWAIAAPGATPTVYDTL